MPLMQIDRLIYNGKKAGFFAATLLLITYIGGSLSYFAYMKIIYNILPSEIEPSRGEVYLLNTICLISNTGDRMGFDWPSELCLVCGVPSFYACKTTAVFLYTVFLENYEYLYFLS